MRAGDARRAELYNNGCWEEHQQTSPFSRHCNTSCKLVICACIALQSDAWDPGYEAGQNASRFYPISQTSRGRAWGALSRNLF
jgi:hypothetical protein